MKKTGAAFDKIRLCLLLCAFVLFSSVLPSQAMAGVPLDGKKLEALSDGKEIDLGKKAKGKPLYLVFSTPTCPYCREELILLESMRKTYPEDKISMLTVFPPGASREVIWKILTERWGVKSIPGYLDKEAKLFQAYDIRGVPYSVLFDAKGRQVTTFEDMPQKSALEAALRGALGK